MDYELKIKELETALAQVTADRDNLAAQLAAFQNGGFDFQKTMERIEAKDEDNARYKEQMQAAFGESLHTPTQFI